MKALVHTGPETVDLQNREQPEPAPDEVLVKVHTAGLCGSDAHAYLYEEGYKWIPIPRIMGHEYSGEVVATGDNVTDFATGDRIIEHPIHQCGSCFQCRNGQLNVCQNFSITGMHRDGAYREFLTVNPKFLHKVPDELPLRHAAITEPASIATRAVLSRSSLTPGDTVLVLGPGPIGVLVAAVADSLGARVLVGGLQKDTQYRLPLVEELGIETTNIQDEDLQQRLEVTAASAGFDVVFDTTGHYSGLETAVEVVRKGGQIVVVGLPAEESQFSLTPLVRGEISIDTSYGSSWRNFEQALRLIESQDIDAETIIDDSFSVSHPQEAFRAFLNSETCKPVFSFSNV